MNLRYLVGRATTAAAFAMLAAIAPAQVSSNQSLNGKYYFRQVMLITDGTANIIDTRTAFGTVSFDGNGNATFTAQQLVGTTPAAALTGTGSYTVKPGGFTTLSNPLRLGVSTINARLGNGALVGSSTEAGPSVFDLFIAIPAPAQAISNTLLGSYWISSLEFPNGGPANIRATNFKLSSTGGGSFNETSVTGQAANLGNHLMTQTVSPMTYAISPDGTATFTFPAGAGLDATTQLIAGAKSMYVSSDETFFIGGSTAAGGHGLVVGVKAFPNGATNTSWSDKFWTAGMRYDTSIGPAGARVAAVAGSVNVAAGNSIWARRTRQSDGLFDASPLIAYSLGGDGSGLLTSTPGHVNVASTGQTFVTTGVDIFDSTSYELYFGTHLLPQSGTGVFVNPQGVLNGASFAPPGYPVSPGGLITLFGTGLGTQTAQAQSLPFPTTLGGVQMTVNGVAAPLYSVTPSQISGVVPFATTGTTATVVVTVNSTKSNSVDVPLANTAPGIFSLAQNGIGDAAILHANYQVVNAANPAAPGEIVQVYLTGLGATTPTVPDGAAAPTKPLAIANSPVNVYVGGLLVTNVQFKGLAPTLAGLYQLNIQIPANVGPGDLSLAVQTVEGFTDMTTIQVAGE
ncbi:MAG TPA: hypothetical protein VN841_23405 [Bryobacteraceae bacterium]|nr:hypothetical protein [Bryobacteraceae bacterium]